MLTGGLDPPCLPRPADTFSYLLTATCFLPCYAILRSLPRNPDLIAVVLLGVVCSLVLATPDLGRVHPVAAVLLVVLLPGYALTAALGPDDEGALVIGVYTIGLGLTAAILGGLIAQGLTDFSRLAAATPPLLTTIVASLVAFKRRGSESAQIPLLVPNVSLLAGGIVAMAIALAGGALVYAVDSARDQRNAADFTSFWVIPSENDEPLASPEAAIGVKNRSHTAQSYILSIRRGRTETWNAAFQLRPGETKQTLVPVGSYQDAATRAYLFHSDAAGGETGAPDRTLVIDPLIDD